MTGIETVTLEYFESGHTFMAADTVHEEITKKFKMTKEVYDFDYFVNNIKTSHDSKVVYPKGFNIYNLKVIQFRSGYLTMFANNEYKGEFEEIHILKRKYAKKLFNDIAKGKTDLLDELPRKSKASGITEIKKGMLLLCKSVPSSRTVFYKNLVVSCNPIPEKFY
ncbi:hypothetical protein HHI36_017228 [Cryptolaemus montrouzieri]|uniref:Uncharacterized protein n=1 Tax=Cryptolaemus montrouzieri TaxID=559131 RepID=A0ABD2NMB0_9CUCU